MSDLEKLLSIEWLPLGTLINAFCILMGGLVGLRLCRQLTDRTQHSIRKFLGVLTFLAGSYMIANGLNGGWKALGSFWKFLGLCGIALLAISFGNLFGAWMKLQEHLDRLGQAAKNRFAKLKNDQPATFSDGFVTCTILFTVGPMSLLGAMEDGLGNVPTILLVKSVMDGIATLCFAPRFGAGVLLSIVPLVAYQGTLTLLSSNLVFVREEPALLATFNLVGGLLVLTIILVILELQKVPLANYLPALVVGPLLTWWWLV